jgi:signal peptidase II
MSRRWLLPVVVFVVTVLADQGSKAWARDALPHGRPVSVVDGFWDWELAYNRGAAFSMLGDSNARIALSLIGVVALLAIGWMLLRARPDQRLLRAGLAFAAGGALGNLIDRIGTGAVTERGRWNLCQLTPLIRPTISRDGGTFVNRVVSATVLRGKHSAVVRNPDG